MQGRVLTAAATAVAVPLLAGLSCILAPGRWPRRTPPGRAGGPARFFHRAIGSFTAAGAALPAASALLVPAGTDGSGNGGVDAVACGVLAASTMILVQMAYDLLLNTELPESLAYPLGKGKLPVSAAHKVFVGLTVCTALAGAAAMGGRVAGRTSLNAWIAYTLLRGLVLSSVNTPEKTKTLVIDSMFPIFEDTRDGAGLAALAWAVPALGRVLFCLCFQAVVVAFAGGGSPTLSGGVFAAAAAAGLR